MDGTSSDRRPPVPGRRAPVLADLMPAGVHAVQSSADFPSERLWPEEAQQIRHAVHARRQEFIAVRVCARRALARAGRPASPILNGVHREPLWPEGIVGSLTHCPGYRAAAVADARDIACLGIDAEVNRPLPEGVGDHVMLPAERRGVDDLRARAPRIAWDRLCFSAKESVFKAWFPTARRWAEFTECQISFDEKARTFRARLLTDPLYVDRRPVTVVHGRWAASGTHVMTAVCLELPRRSAGSGTGSGDGREEGRDEGRDDCRQQDRTGLGLLPAASRRRRPADSAIGEAGTLTAEGGSWA